MARRMKLTVSYLGTPFCGWQRQRRGRTVQAEIEAALARMLPSNPPRIVGAGRTDSGVHAAGQVAHLDVPERIPPSGVLRFLNNSLPPEIRVRSAVPVPDRFHARFDALGKLYVYRARWSRPVLPWHDVRSAVVRRVNDLHKVIEAAEMLVGTHDVASFSVPNAVPGPTTRTIFRLTVTPRAGGVAFEVLGDGFLRYQVRRMVGALVEVGWGRRSREDFRSLIDQPHPGSRLTSAPACGLTLERVYYRRVSAMASPATSSDFVNGGNPGIVATRNADG